MTTPNTLPPLSHPFGGVPAAEEHTAFAVTLMEHLVVPTFVLDGEGKVLIWNKACERLTGVSASEVIGTRNHWHAFYDTPRPCLADLVLMNNWDTIDSLYTTHDDPSTPVYGVHAENWCVMPRRGQRLYLAVDAGPVFDAGGELIAIVETLRDITEKKMAEAKVQEQADMLQRHYDANEREAEMARRILEHQIRGDLMQQAGVRYQVIPATNFSGDMVLAARSPNGRLYALLADATGHGLAAAVSVLPVVQEFYRMVDQGAPLGSLVESINFVLSNSLPVGRFVATAIVAVDQQLREGEVWVAGVPEVLLVDQEGMVRRRFVSRHLPLGVVRQTEANETVEKFTWDFDGQLVLISDGVVEATSPAGEGFGEDRLIRALADGDGEQLIARVHQALTMHLDGDHGHDDMSIMVVDCPK